MTFCGKGWPCWRRWRWIWKSRSRSGRRSTSPTAERTTQRNGIRERAWETRVGRIELQIPKLRHGSYFPSLLEPRRRVEQALLNVVQQAYIEGVSTRRVDDLVQALGLQGIDKSLVSRACKELDGVVTEFRNRPLTQRYPYVWLDALYLKVRQNRRIVSLAAVIAIGVWETGERHVRAWRWAPARANRSGASSCAVWCSAGCRGCSSSSAMPTKG